MNSGTDSAMMYLVPSTRVTTVSGVQSTRSTRSGFRPNTAPLRRVTRITTTVLGCSGWWASPWPRHLSFDARPGRLRRKTIRVGIATAPQPAAPGHDEGPAGGGSLVVPFRASALDVDQVLQQLVRGGDNPGVGLEAALGDDQVRELLRQVDVRHLEHAAGDEAEAELAGGADLRQAGVDRGAVHRVADLLQAGDVVEVRHGELAQHLVQAVGEDADDLAPLGDAVRRQRARGGAVAAVDRRRVAAAV